MHDGYHNPPAGANARRETEKQLQALKSQVVKIDDWPQGRKKPKKPMDSQLINTGDEQGGEIGVVCGRGRWRARGEEDEGASPRGETPRCPAESHART